MVPFGKGRLKGTRSAWLACASQRDSKRLGTVMTEKDIKKAEEQDMTMDEPDDAEAHAKPRAAKGKGIRTPSNGQSKRQSAEHDATLEAQLAGVAPG